MRVINIIIRNFHPFREPSKLQQYIARAPSKQEPPWTRLALKIKTDENIIIEKQSNNVNNTNNKHVEKLKQQFDPQTQLLKLEDELQEEMAFALSRTGQKMEYFYRLLKIAENNTNNNEKSTTISFSEKLKAINEFNNAIDAALKAREELIIHRQSLGFTWKNQSIIEEQYPIPKRKITPTSS